MSSLKERLLVAIGDQPIGPTELANACGVKPPSASGWLSGDSKTMKALPLLLAARFLDVDPYWLLTGKPATSAPAAKATVHTLQERQPPAYAAPVWPFDPKYLDEINALTERQKGFVEGQLAAAIGLCQTGAKLLQKTNRR